VLIVLVIIELAVRWMIPAERIPKGAYHSSEFRQQVEQYTDAVPVDMLIVGSSVAAVNYPPSTLDARLQESGYSGFTSYNAGIRGCNYECIAKGVRRFFLQQFQPPTVLLVVNAIDINDDSEFVVERSRRYAADMERGSISRAGRNMLSGISYIYGFKEELRDWLTSGQLTFDPAVLKERGHVDMGSVERGRFEEVPHIESQSSSSQSLQALVNELAEDEITVIILPVDGDSMARAAFNEVNRMQFRQLLDQMTDHQNVHELVIDLEHFSDSDYIDTMHLNSQSAQSNGELLAERLVQSGLLKEP